MATLKLRQKHDLSANPIYQFFAIAEIIALLNDRGDKEPASFMTRYSTSIESAECMTGIDLQALEVSL
jgi:hypothetical protein